MLSFSLLSIFTGPGTAGALAGVGIGLEVSGALESTGGAAGGSEVDPALPSPGGWDAPFAGLSPEGSALTTVNVIEPKKAFTASSSMS